MNILCFISRRPLAARTEDREVGKILEDVFSQNLIGMKSIQQQNFFP